jgi:hypothetical protein
MVFRHGRKTGIIVGTTNLTGFLNEASASASVETAETTTYGKDSKTYIIGIKDGTFSLSGMFDGGVDAIDDVFSSLAGINQSAPIFVQQGYATTDEPGIPATFAIGHLTSYETSAPLGDVVSVSAEINAEEGLYAGLILHDPTDEIHAGFQRTAAVLDLNNSSVDAGASTSNGMRAQVHFLVNSLDGGTVLTIEDSPDNSTWTTLATFATAAAATLSTEQISATGTVERYVRLNVDTTASTSGVVEFAVGFHRFLAT